MNRIATTLVMVAFACGAHAATIEWGINMDALLYVTEDGSTVQMANKYDEDTTGWAFCLTYLGSSSTIDIGNVSDANVIKTLEYSVYDATDAAYVDHYSGPTFTTTGSALAIDGTVLTIAAGDYFGIVFYNGTSYSTLYTVENGAITGSLTPTASLPSISATANTVALEANASGIAVSAAAVPEPSVALMGLLGLGMLLKRRKA